MSNPIRQPWPQNLYANETNPTARLRDVLGKLKVSQSQNIFDADFEYGEQKMRWESFTVGGGSVLHIPAQGGCRLSVGASNGDLAIRQTRPYHRYQPGKSMYMASGVVFGPAITNQRQRVGMFDDANGVFFEQGDATAANPYGMYACYRSDINGLPTTVAVSAEKWTDPYGALGYIDWTLIQMIWIEYAWYGAGSLRWGVVINGEPYILHEQPIGNLAAQGQPWCRTGSLPSRYELRNVGAATAQSMTHYGVSVLVEGRIDDQRGFTYGYGMGASGTGGASPVKAVSANLTRFPILSLRYRVMGTLEYGVDANYSGTNGTLPAGGGAIQSGATTTSATVAGTPWTAGQWVGKYVFFRGLGSSGQGQIGRITANTNNTLTYVNPVTGAALANAPGAGANYIIGLVNRGQILPRLLNIFSSANCTLELVSSRFDNPVTLTNSAWFTNYRLGSQQSFGERDIAADNPLNVAGVGEVVYNSPLPSAGLQSFDLSNFFPLYNNILGNQPDILTVAITTGTNAALVGAGLVAQEAMS